MKKNPVVHFEMPYDDAKRLSDFYAKAFGWQMNQLDANMGGYVIAQTAETDEHNMVKTPGAINGGFAKRSEHYDRPNLVIAVEDIKAAVERVRGAGGEVLGEPMEIPGIGQYASFTDTEGNKVSMLEPNERM